MVAVVNLKHEPALRAALALNPVHDNTVLVDRRTTWGNRFRIGRDGTREQVVARYRTELWQRIRAGEISLVHLADLAGRPLACWCFPKRCHAEVLARAAAWAAAQLARNP